VTTASPHRELGGTVDGAEGLTVRSTNEGGAMSPRSAAQNETLREQRRAAILEAGLQQFAEDGFERATVGAVARRAGVSQGLIYHYFAGKDDLLRAVFARSMAAVDATLVEAASTGAPTPSRAAGASSRRGGCTTSTRVGARRWCSCTARPPGRSSGAISSASCGPSTAASRPTISASVSPNAPKDSATRPRPTPRRSRRSWTASTCRPSPSWCTTSAAPSRFRTRLRTRSASAASCWSTPGSGASVATEASSARRRSLPARSAASSTST
jgi:hypothetical protein